MPDPSRASSLIGILSLLLWALVLTVTVKYVLILLEADNNGEGGSLTLVALAQRTLGRRSFPVLVMGMAGAGPLLWRRGDHPGDLRALRCRRAEARDAAFESYVLPIALVILIGALRGPEPRHRDGSPRSSVPSRLVWFITMAALGLLHIADDPGVFLSLNPYYGVAFLVTHPGHRLRDSRRRVPRRHRRRGALRRSRPFRPPARSASPGSPSFFPR